MDRDFGWNIAAFPRMRGVRRQGLHQLQPHAVYVAKPKHSLAKALREQFGADGILLEPLAPESQRAWRHSERRGCHLAISLSPAPGSGPCKERQDSPRTAVPVAIVEMIGFGIVEVDGHLDKTQSQDASVEIHVLLRIARNRRDVMNSENRLHCQPPPSAL